MLILFGMLGGLLEEGPGKLGGWEHQEMDLRLLGKGV